MTSDETRAQERRFWVAAAAGAALVALYFAGGIEARRVLPSDGAFAAFFEPFRLWNGLWMAGWPVHADVASYPLYPVRFLFPRTLNGFNAFVASAYLIHFVLFARFLFLLTRSVLAAVSAALVATLSGFMIAHLGHTSMVHSAAWIPGVLLGVKLGERRVTAVGVFVLAACTCLSILAGHAQTWLYGAALAGAYSLTLVARSRGSSVAAFAAGSLGGIGLAAAQILPTLAFAKTTHRAALTVQQLSEYSLPPSQLAQVFFPYLFGSFDGDRYAGLWNWSEMNGGLGVVVATACATYVAREPRRPGARFWAVAAISSLVFACAGYFPWLAAAIHATPVLRDFRVFARAFLCFDLALAVLFAFVIATLLEAGASRRDPLRAFVGIGAVAAFGGACYSHGLTRFDALREIGPQVLPSIAAQLGIGVVVVACLVVARGAGRRAAIGTICALAVIEAAGLGWFAPWRTERFLDASAEPTPAVRTLEARLRRHATRLATASGWETRWLSPDRTRRLRLPSVGWYGPLLEERFAALAGLTSGGWLRPEVFAPSSFVLDLLGVELATGYHRDVGVHGGRTVASEPLTGIAWSDVHLAFDDDLHVSTVHAEYAAPCTALPLEVLAPTFSAESRSGGGTTSWLPSRASCSARSGGGSIVELSVPDHDLAGLSLRPISREGTPERLTLVTNHGEIPLVATDLALFTGTRWLLHSFEANEPIFRNTRVIRSRFQVANVLPMSDESALATLRTGVLPDGHAFDPRAVALVSLQRTAKKPPRFRAWLGRTFSVFRGERFVVHGEHEASLLVLRQNLAPGWIATVNGRPTYLEEVDYDLAAVPIGAGRNEIQLFYVPLPFLRGVAVSALVVLVFVTFFARRLARAGRSRTSVVAAEPSPA